MGSPSFAVPALEALIPRHRVVLVVTQTDKPAGRGKQVTSPPVKVIAERAGIPVIQPKSARTPEFRDALVATKADVGVVVAYGKILPRPVLEAFPHGCINIHGSLLPAYRGAAPIQWALINGETTTGITIMKLDEGMDTGPMLLRREIRIPPDASVESLSETLAPLGASMLIEVLDQLTAGTLIATPQDASRATHAPLLQKHHGVIDWTQPATAIAHRIRGVDPWPGAVTQLAGQPLKLFSPRPVDGRGSPGEVLGIDERGVIVACGMGACAIAEVQAPGKRRMSAREFALGHQLVAGTILG
jgi:methionyl-tRNA formyltransferase